MINRLIHINGKGFAPSHVWLITITIALLLPLFTMGQGLNRFYYRDSSTSYTNRILDITYHEGYLYTAGRAFDSTQHQGIWFQKLDTLGNIIAENVITDGTGDILTTYSDIGQIKCMDNQCNFYGAELSTNSTFLMTVDTVLSLQSLQYYDIPNNYYQGLNYNFTKSPDGSRYYLFGAGAYFVAGFNYDFIDLITIVTDANGAELHRFIHGEFGVEEALTSVIWTPDTTLLALTQYTEPIRLHSDRQVMSHARLYEIDSVGSYHLVWDGDNVLPFEYALEDMAMDEAGNILLVGESLTWNEATAGPNEYDPLYIMLDSNYNLLFYENFPAQGLTMNYSNAEYDVMRNKFLGIGRKTHKENGEWILDVNVLKLESNGNITWDAILEPNISSDSISIFIDDLQITGSTLLPSGSTVGAGYGTVLTTYGWGTYGWVFKVTADGCVDIVNCTPVAITDPSYTGLPLTIYPNPATTTITLTAPPPGHYTTQIIDLQGRLHHQQALSTYDTTMVDVQHLPQGLYIVQVLDKQGQVVGRGKFVKQ